MMNDVAGPAFSIGKEKLRGKYPFDIINYHMCLFVVSTGK